MRMFKRGIKFSVFTLLMCFSFYANAAETAKGKIYLPDELKWEDVPNISHIKMAVLMGDPRKSEPFILRIKLPASFSIPPHTHPVNEYNTVISGSYNIGFGEKFDKNATTHIAPGTFVVIPANVPHFGWTEEGAILQADAEGPWGMTPIKNK